MAALAFAEIVKTFGRNSPNAGQVRLSQITRKISEQSEFEMESGPNKLLYFKDDAVKKAYEIAENKQVDLRNLSGEEWRRLFGTTKPE